MFSIALVCNFGKILLLLLVLFSYLHFQVSITLLICCAIYAKILLPETLSGSPRPQHFGPSTVFFKILQERWYSMKDTLTLIRSRYVILFEITLLEYIPAILLVHFGSLSLI